MLTQFLEVVSKRGWFLIFLFNERINETRIMGGTFQMKDLLCATLSACITMEVTGIIIVSRSDL